MCCVKSKINKVALKGGTLVRVEYLDAAAAVSQRTVRVVAA